MSTQIDEDIELVINGNSYKGWQDVAITIQIDALARSFRLQMGYEERGNFADIVPDAPCEIYINGFKRITGRIDDIDSQKTPTTHTRVISGRSITRNLIDSSIHIKTNHLNNVTLEDLCNRFCDERFGVSVINEAGDLPKIPVVRWSDGARYGRVMQDEARKIGVTIRDDADGNIVLTRPRTRPSRGAISEGSGGKGLADSNIESWRVVRSVQGRFSHYVVKGRASKEDGQSGNQKLGEFQDDGVQSFRPIIIKAEGDITNAIAKQRAAFEAQRRLGLSYQVGVSVSGWRHQTDGEPWRIDEIVPVSIPTENINNDLLTRRIVHKKSRGGSTTDIDFVDPSTMTPQPSGSSSGKPAKATFDASSLIRDIGPRESIFDIGTTISSGNGIAG